jgi:hypothetical protein
MKAKAKPDGQAFETAIEWLKCNEGGDGEAEDCKEVAEWLRWVLALDDERRLVAQTARRHGVSANDARQRLIKHGLIEAFASRRTR